MIRRTYKCEDCGDTFEVTCESNDPHADCPYCKVVMNWQPGNFAITTNKAKAVDLTQKIVEEDYGMSNLKDNNREGDVAYKPPSPQTTQEREAETRMMIEASQQIAKPAMHPSTQGFWGGGAGGAPPMVAQSLIAAAKTGPGAGSDPISMLHKAGKAGQLPNNYRIIARSNG